MKKKLLEAHNTRDFTTLKKKEKKREHNFLSTGLLLGLSIYMNLIRNIAYFESCAYFGNFTAL